MTHRDAKNIFQRGFGIAEWIAVKRDKPALREEWNNFTDRLCKDGQITPRQYDRWQNPFLRKEQGG
jgi:hypothetical protein